MVPRPHFLLFCDGQSPKVAAKANAVGAASAAVRGRWRFILEDLDAGTRLEAGDAELIYAPERAALLAVVRGLEALEQPSKVTLVTTSRYVSRGLQFGLSEWRESDYCWEHFGSVQPIRNADLWRRIDHAMQFHQISCQWIAGEVDEVGDTITKMEIEPMATSSVDAAERIFIPSEATDRRGGNQTLSDADGDQPPVAPLGPSKGQIRWEKCLVWLSRPIRSLRLPKPSTFLTSLRQNSWIGKHVSRWLMSNDGRSGLAI